MSSLGLSWLVGHAADDAYRGVEHAGVHGDVQVVVVRRQADGDTHAEGDQQNGKNLGMQVSGNAQYLIDISGYP